MCAKFKRKIYGKNMTPRTKVGGNKIHMRDFMHASTYNLRRKLYMRFQQQVIQILQARKIDYLNYLG
jgi:hypothetical protein